MTRSLLTTVALVLTLALAGCSGTAPVATAQPTLERQGDRYVATRTETLEAAPGGTLDLGSRNGSITLSTWSRDEVRVRETIELRGFDRDGAERYLREHATTYETDGNTVRVRTPDRDSDRRVGRSFDVRVPTRFAADLQTAGGSIAAEGIEGRLEAQTAGGGIQVQSVTGAVRIRTAGGALRVASVDGSVDGRTAGGAIDVDGVTGTLDVKTAGGGIRITGADSEVEAQTAGGSIVVEDVGGALRARTMGGNVRVRSARRSIDVATTGGDVTLRDIAGTARARTTGGDIDGERLAGRADLKTSAGDVILRGARAGVEAQTSVGDVEVEFSADAQGDYASTLTTSHGDIRLILPAGFEAGIDAEAESYSGRAGREDIYSDFPLTRRQDEGSATIRASGALNGGGPSFTLRARGGSIRIERRN